MDNRVGGGGGGGGGEYHDFLSIFFCRRLPKIFEAEPFCVVFQKISGSDKDNGQMGGGM